MSRLDYGNVLEPRFSDAAESAIDCLVVFIAYGPNPLPFTASPTDDTAHGVEIYQRCLAGEFGPVAPFETAQPVAAPEPAPPAKKRAKPKPAKKRKPERLVLLKPRTRRAAKPRPATKPPKRKR